MPRYTSQLARDRLPGQGKPYRYTRAAFYRKSATSTIFTNLLDRELVAFVFHKRRRDFLLEALRESTSNHTSICSKANDIPRPTRRP